MRTINNLLQVSLKLDIPFQVENAMIDTRDDYIDLQRKQMLRGLLRTGGNIYRLKTGSPFYSKRYAQYKGFDFPINLKDKGDFQNELFLVVDVVQGSFVTDSADEKSGMLQDVYGEDIMGLDNDNKQDYVDGSLGPKFVRNVKAYLSLP